MFRPFRAHHLEHELMAWRYGTGAERESVFKKPKTLPCTLRVYTEHLIIQSHRTHAVD